MFTNQIDEILELNCDEYVLQGKEQACRIEYAEILLNQIERNKGKQCKFSMSFANRKENIMKRFSNIVDKSNKKSVISLGIVLTALLLISVTLIICIPNINFALVDDDSTVNNIIDENNISTNIDNAANLDTIDNSTNENTNISNNSTTENIILVEGNEDKREDYINSITNESIEDNKNNEGDKEEINLVEDNKENDGNTNRLSLNNTEEEARLVETPNDTENIVLENPLKDGYVVTSRFGMRSTGIKHMGTDIAAQKGTDILACAPGTVVFAGYKGSYGNLVIVQHTDSMQTFYAHCDEICVKEGERVNSGDIIAKVGTTGDSTGPHLHLEVREEGIAKNPQDYIEF